MPKGQRFRQHGTAGAGAPAPRALAHLRPTDAAGAGFVTVAVALTSAGIGLAGTPGWATWIAGEILLAIAFIEWFVILHEAGHDSLFRRRSLNRLAGSLAGFFALIPFGVWRRIHQRHHKWTGWQDKDPTTAALVPRPLGRLERAAANLCWRFWIPLFAFLYRANNFWHAPRVLGLFTAPRDRRRLIWSMAGLLIAYATLLAAVGPMAVLATAGPALVLAFVVEDVLLISQHTHMPMELSNGTAVAPFPPAEQQPFTRSLRLPPLISWLLLRFDAHELHHMYPAVPGYRLHEVPYAPSNEVSWREWIPAARAVPGEVLLFQNRDTSGFDL